jgi:hypothetical protein
MGAIAATIAGEGSGVFGGDIDISLHHTVDEDYVKRFGKKQTI